MDSKFHAMPEVKQECLITCILLHFVMYVTFIPIFVFIISGIIGALIIIAVIAITIMLVAYIGNHGPHGFDLKDFIIMLGLTNLFTCGYTMWRIVLGDDTMPSCIYYNGRVNWFILNPWKIVHSKYIQIKTTDITLYKDFQLVSVTDYGKNVDAHVRIRNDDEEALVYLMQ